MYIHSILWYLSWPVLIGLTTIIIFIAVKRFERKHGNSN